MIDAVRATDQPAAALLSWHQSPSRLPIMWMVSTILNISSRLVVVGTGLVANAERDTFKLKVSPESPSLEEQVRARPKFAMFAVAAAASSTHCTHRLSRPRHPRLANLFLRPTTPTASAASDVELDGPICLQRPQPRTASAASDSFLVRPTFPVS